MRRTVTLDVMLPLLYLKGISTGEFTQVMDLCSVLQPSPSRLMSLAD